MTFTPSDEQEQLRATVRGFLAQASPMSEVRRLMSEPWGFDEAVWAEICKQLQLVGLAVPEAYGGSGYSARELAIVFEEAGAVLLCAPLLSNAAMVPSLILATHDAGAAARYLPAICDGTMRAAVGLCESDGLFLESSMRTVAEKDGQVFRLTGRKMFVVDGASADLLFVVARAAAGIGVFAVEPDAEGVSRTAMVTMDETRRQAVVGLDAVPAVLVGDLDRGWDSVAAMLDFTAALLASEQVGGAQRCLDMAVGYARERVQFGRKIGSFQAIKHKCADVLLGVESARSAALYAAWAASEAPGELPVAASLASSFCSEAYVTAAAENIQVHGGIGFTWEHDAHLYFKRAVSSSACLGGPAFHREQLVTHLGI